jgi:hypothetical protein
VVLSCVVESEEAKQERLGRDKPVIVVGEVAHTASGNRGDDNWFQMTLRASVENVGVGPAVN